MNAVIKHRSDDFLADLRATVTQLAEGRGLSPTDAREMAHTLAILISSKWGGARQYVPRSEYVEYRHADIISRWQRAKSTATSAEAAAATIGKEVGCHWTSVFRIVAKARNKLHPRVID